MEIIDNSFLRQFETKVSGGLAIIEYSVQERKIFLTKIFVPEMKSKDEFSELFISEVLEMIIACWRAKRETVQALKSYIIELQ